MGLTDKKEEQLKKMPQMETKLFKSKDGKFLIHQTIITSIKPSAYYEAIMASENYVQEENAEIPLEE